MLPNHRDKGHVAPQTRPCMMMVMMATVVMVVMTVIMAMMLMMVLVVMMRRMRMMVVEMLVVVVMMTMMATPMTLMTMVVEVIMTVAVVSMFRFRTQTMQTASAQAAVKPSTEVEPPSAPPPYIGGNCTYSRLPSLPRKSSVRSSCRFAVELLIVAAMGMAKRSLQYAHWPPGVDANSAG